MSPNAGQLALQTASRELKNYFHHFAQWLSACTETGGKKPADLKEHQGTAPVTAWLHTRGGDQTATMHCQ